MSYKIYTYADPYSIAQTDFWEEISIILNYALPGHW